MAAPEVPAEPVRLFFDEKEADEVKKGEGKNFGSSFRRRRKAVRTGEGGSCNQRSACEGEFGQGSSEMDWMGVGISNGGQGLVGE